MEFFSENLKKDHLLSKVDARVKLIVSFALLAMVLSYRGFPFPLFVALLCLLLFIRMKVPLKFFIARFSEPVFIASVILLLKIFFSGEAVLFSKSIFGLQIIGYKDGLREGLSIGCRIIGGVSILSALSLTTPFAELMAGLSWLKVPKGFIEILIFAYRYIFVLVEDAMVIYNAQKNRLGYSSPGRGLKSFGILAGSLTLKAFESCQAVTTAMVQRGYDGNIPLMKHKPFRPSEIAASILMVAVMGLIWKI